MIHLLLESGAVEVNNVDKQGRTPLFWACDIDNFQASARLFIAIRLLWAGAQPDVVDHHENTLRDRWAGNEKKIQMESIIKDVKERRSRAKNLFCLQPRW